MLLYYVGEFVALLILAAVEGAWAPYLRVLGQAPALVLTLVVLVGMIRGPEEGVWAGLMGVLCVGSLTGAPLGGLFVGYMGAGLLCGLLGRQIFPERLSILMLIVFVTVVLVRLVGLLFSPPPAFGTWVLATFAGAVFTAPVALPLAWVVRLILHRPPGIPQPGGAGLYLPRG